MCVYIHAPVSTVQQSDSGFFTYIYIYIHIYSFSYIILHHVLKHSLYLIASLPFLSNSMCIFPTTLLYKSLSASLQLGLNENCSTCRCIFDVFMVGGEFNILLLQHLDLISLIQYFLEASASPERPVNMLKIKNLKRKL